MKKHRPGCASKMKIILEPRILGTGFRVQGLGFRVQGLGLGAGVRSVGIPASF